MGKEYGGGMARILKALLFLYLLTLSLSCKFKGTEPYYGLHIKRENPEIHIKIDRDFSQKEKELIARAFHSWEVASQNKLRFILTWNQPKPGDYKNHLNPSENAGIFLWHLPKKPAEADARYPSGWKIYYGLMNYGRGENSGNIIVFKKIPKDKFYSVVVHEVGHLIGLNHNSELTWSIMHPSAVAHCITQLDAEKLCKLYNCTPISQCKEN